MRGIWVPAVEYAKFKNEIPLIFWRLSTRPKSHPFTVASWVSWTCRTRSENRFRILGSSQFTYEMTSLSVQAKMLLKYVL